MSHSTDLQLVTINPAIITNKTENDLLNLYKVLIRGTSCSIIQDKMAQFMDNPSTLADAFVITFMTRAVKARIESVDVDTSNIRTGERLLFNHMWLYLLQKHSSLTLSLLDLVPYFGCWSDITHLDLSTIHSSQKLVILTFLKKQLEADEEAMFIKEASGPSDNIGNNVSLLAKWLPREKSKHDAFARIFAEFIEDNNQAKASHLSSYRRRVATLNKHLHTPEIAMCAGKWASIDPTRVSMKCFSKNKAAFLNEKISKQLYNLHTLRNPLSKDRNTCRANFQKYFKDKKGKSLIDISNDITYTELRYQLDNMLYDSIRERIFSG